MCSHEVDYTIHGDDHQFVEIELDPSESAIAEAGNLKSQSFGGEGLFLATLQGSGRVWLQSLPIASPPSLGVRVLVRVRRSADSRPCSNVDSATGSVS